MPTGSSSSTTNRFLIPSFLGLAAIFGSSFLFIKVAIGELHPLYVTLGRVALGGITLLIVMAVLRHRLPRDPRLWGHMAVLGTVGVALPFTLFGFGEQHIPSLLAGIWNATTPLVALPLAVLAFGTERFTSRKVIGIGVGFLGVLVVLGVWQGVGGAVLAGQLMCFAAAACYGVAIPYMKRFVAHQPVSGVALVAGQMICATILMAVVAPLFAGPPPAPSTLSGGVVGSMLVLGAVGTGVALLLHLRNIRLVGASAASLVTYLIPLFAVLTGMLVLGETLSWYQPAGALVVLAGVAISQGFRPRWRRSAAPATPVVEPATTLEPATPATPPVLKFSAPRPTPPIDQPARC